jgi:hypothetical protein
MQGAKGSTTMKTLAITLPRTVTISYKAPSPVEKTEIVRAVLRAVNAWYYTL